METQGGVQLLLLLYVVSTCWGQQGRSRSNHVMYPASGLQAAVL